MGFDVTVFELLLVCATVNAVRMGVAKKST
jgi:hypothetical protein